MAQLSVNDLLKVPVQFPFQGRKIEPVLSTFTAATYDTVPWVQTTTEGQ